jgi:glycosyltransferase involved in cell wall biosynthesis
MVGGGPLQSETECLAGELGIADRVRWIGVVDDVGTYLHAADVFLLTSDTEGIPGALLEAMTVGLPSVVTRVGGIPEVVEEATTGFLVAPDDEDALGERLVGLSADPELRRRLGENAARIARGLFGMRRCAAEHEEFYQSLRTVPKC